MFKKILTKFLGKRANSEQPVGHFIVAQLNEKVGPIDRGLVYEDPLEGFLKEKYYGEVTGGGTFQEETGELSCFDIEIELTSIDAEIIEDIITKLESLGAPKGSKIIIDKTEEEIAFGKKEGLALYIDGIGLPSGVYEECDINFVWSELLHTGARMRPSKKSVGFSCIGRYHPSSESELSKFLNWQNWPVIKGGSILHTID